MASLGSIQAAEGEARPSRDPGGHCHEQAEGARALPNPTSLIPCAPLSQGVAATLPTSPKSPGSSVTRAAAWESGTLPSQPLSG